jgi:predicted TIM-barrel fold metal-dependent hydrolase
VIIDSHQHFWDPATADYPWMTDEVAPLRRRFGPEDLEPLLREHGVAGTVVVQARSSLDETRTLLAIAAETPFVLGVVGWVDLTGDVGRQLRDLDANLVGVRHQVHDEPDPAWLLRDDVQRGLDAVAEAGLVYDLLVRARELPAAVETARRHPGARLVLDQRLGRTAAGDVVAWSLGRVGGGRGAASPESSPQSWCGDESLDVVRSIQSRVEDSPGRTSSGGCPVARRT